MANEEGSAVGTGVRERRESECERTRTILTNCTATRIAPDNGYNKAVADDSEFVYELKLKLNSNSGTMSLTI